jgi:hypothetical protein
LVLPLVGFVGLDRAGDQNPVAAEHPALVLGFSHDLSICPIVGHVQSSDIDGPKPKKDPGNHHPSYCVNWRRAAGGREPMTWPWPRDSREDRAKRVALSYRHLVETFARANADTAMAAALAELDDRWCELGAGWVRPTGALDLDAWLTGADMAELFHQEPMTVYAWGRRGNIRVQVVDGIRRYNVGDVVAYQRRRRLRR